VSHSYAQALLVPYLGPTLVPITPAGWLDHMTITLMPADADKN
jgi:hypothetical protein